MKMKSATWLNACQLASAERGAVVLRCGGYSGYTSCRQPTGGGPAGNDLVLRPPAAETAAAPPGSARAAHAAEDSRSTPRLDSAMGGSISSRCSTRAAPRHAGPAGREPGLYLVSAALRAVAAVPRPARADLPGAPRTSRRCRLRPPATCASRALKSSLGPGQRGRPTEAARPASGFSPPSTIHTVLCHSSPGLGSTSLLLQGGRPPWLSTLSSFEVVY